MLKEQGNAMEAMKYVHMYPVEKLFCAHLI